MSQRFNQLEVLHQASLQIAAHVFQLLQEERIELIALNTQKLTEINARKEHLVSELKTARDAVGAHINATFQADTAEALEAQLSSEEAARWTEMKNAWNDQWNDLKMLTEQNQRLLDHSLKNLGKMADNLKRLLGESSRYSQSGTKLDSPNPGRVVETQV